MSPAQRGQTTQHAAVRDFHSLAQPARTVRLPGARLCATAGELRTPQRPNDKGMKVRTQLQNVDGDPQTCCHQSSKVREGCLWRGKHEQMQTLGRTCLLPLLEGAEVARGEDRRDGCRASSQAAKKGGLCHIGSLRVW